MDNFLRLGYVEIKAEYVQVQHIVDEDDCVVKIKGETLKKNGGPLHRVLKVVDNAELVWVWRGGQRVVTTSGDLVEEMGTLYNFHLTGVSLISSKLPDTHPHHRSEVVLRGLHEVYPRFFK